MSIKNKSRLGSGDHLISRHCEALAKASQPMPVLSRHGDLFWWENFSSLVFHLWSLVSKNQNLIPSIFRIKALRLALLFLLFAFSSKAQIYPVQVMPVLVPPYSLNTSDYYNGTSERLAVVLTNTDLQKPVLNVRLRMYIEGQNAKLQSRDGVYYPTITLDAGIPQRISLSDLAPYFNIDNLNFSGITQAMYAQNGKLPEGFYSFCFEAIEINTGQVLSRKSCSMAYITLSDPPLLNLPLKGESIASKAVQNIIFQWTPRNLGSPNGAFNTEYEFTLKELWDTGIAPEAAFESTQPLYQVTVRPTTLLMGPAEPQLIPGKRYAWRVRAVSTSPTGEQADSYRNNGFSEIYWFTYQSDCKPPLAINSSVSSGRVTINWTADPSNGGIPAGGYTLQYRERSLSGSKWYSVNTLENRAILYDLKPGTTYEYRVGSSCVAGNIGIDQATYSDMLTLEINGNPKDTATVNCGMISPEISITNRTPIQALNQGDLIMAGGFPVKLTKVTGGGSFSGEGYVTIPMLGQLNVKVRFSGIHVNTERQLFGGVIETTYDPNEKQIADTKEVFDDVKDLVTGIIDKLKDLLKNPIKNKEEIAKAEKEFSSEYAKMVNQLPISETEKKERLAVYEELSKQVYLASNSSGIDAATIQAASASKKLDELKESVKVDLENANEKTLELIAGNPDYFGQAITRPDGVKEKTHQDAVCIQNNKNQTIAILLPDGTTFFWVDNKGAKGYFIEGGTSYKYSYIFYVEDKYNRKAQPISWGIYLAASDLGGFAIDLSTKPIATTKAFGQGLYKIATLQFDIDKTWQRIIDADATDVSYVATTIALSYLSGPKAKGIVAAEDAPKFREFLEEYASKTRPQKLSWPQLLQLFEKAKIFEALVSKHLATIYKASEGYTIVRQVYLKVDGVISIADDIIYNSKTGKVILNESKYGTKNLLRKNQKIIEDAIKAGKLIEIRSVGDVIIEGRTVLFQGGKVEISKILRSHSIEGIITKNTVKTLWMK